MLRKPLALATLAAVAALFPLAPRSSQPAPTKSSRSPKSAATAVWTTSPPIPPTATSMSPAPAPPATSASSISTHLPRSATSPTTSAHGAVVDDATGHGFATSKPVTMFDAKTFAVIKKIHVQGNPDGYLNDPVQSPLLHPHPRRAQHHRLDDKDGAILTTIDIGGAPEQAASSTASGKIYIDIEDKDAIAVIDANTMKMIGKYDISTKGGGCAGLALDAKNNILFAACRDKNNMVILSATDGKILTDLPIGVGCDGATFNPDTMEAFSSQGDGTLTVIKENSPTSFAVEQTVATPRGAKTITLDTKTGHLLLITAEYGPVPAPAATPAAAPPATAPAAATVAPPAGARPGGPGGFRGPRAPMIPGSFQIVVVGK